MKSGMGEKPFDRPVKGSFEPLGWDSTLCSGSGHSQD